MRRLLFLLLFSVLLTSTVAAEDSCLEAQKLAFKAGFFEQKIDGASLQSEFSKYQVSPFFYVKYFQFLEKNAKAPVVVVKFRRQRDALGQLVITPEVKVKPIEAEDFPKASYLKSVLQYNKDFMDLDKMESATSSSPNATTPATDRLVLLER